MAAEMPIMEKMKNVHMLLALFQSTGASCFKENWLNNQRTAVRVEVNC